MTKEGNTRLIDVLFGGLKGGKQEKLAIGVEMKPKIKSNKDMQVFRWKIETKKCKMQFGLIFIIKIKTKRQRKRQRKGKRSASIK